MNSTNASPSVVSPRDDWDLPGLLVWSVLSVALGFGYGAMVVNPILMWVLS